MEGLLKMVTQGHGQGRSQVEGQAKLQGSLSSDLGFNWCCKLHLLGIRLLFVAILGLVGDIFDMLFWGTGNATGGRSLRNNDLS